ncbi:MAG: flagellar biosynthesis protein FlhB [Hyphomicrobiales bacterium]|nr:MAG: flagellar biosynthesis protein FlhB [Hyphomicrobiales bacterium]
MAEESDKDSKTEEPTEKKIQDAIEKGNVPFSREAATLASLIGMLLIASFFLASGVGELTSTLMKILDQPANFALENRADATLLLTAVAMEAGKLVVPIVIVLGIAGILASALQNPPSIVVDRIMPEMSRISVTSGWKRVFGVQGQVEFLKAVFKFGLVCVVGYFFVKSNTMSVANAIFVEPADLPGLILNLGIRVLATITVATAVLVAADVVWSRIFWHNELRMTRQEIKDELKQSDGDPIIKARLRSMSRDRARKRMMGAVPRATLVITNPTHYAVALRYVREEGGAPLVVAKGKDLIALRIRELAGEHGIPIVENKPLARALYKAVEVDKMIPKEFYKAVAEIIYYLSQRQAQIRPLA